MNPSSTQVTRGGPLVLTALAVLLGGCASHREARLTAREGGPLVDERGHHRSLSLDAPAMAEAAERHPGLQLTTPAYYDRLDRGVRVTAGTQGQVFDRSVTHTRSRFDSNNGRISDDFKQNSQRERVIELVR